MNSLVYDKEQIKCTCFDQGIPLISGLKRFDKMQQNQLNYQIRNNDSQVYKTNIYNDQTKKSLKRNKPFIGKHQRHKTSGINERQIGGKKIVEVKEKMIPQVSKIQTQHFYTSNQKSYKKNQITRQPFQKIASINYLNTQLKTTQIHKNASKNHINSGMKATQFHKSASINYLNTEIKNTQLNRNAKNYLNSGMKNTQINRNASKNYLNSGMKNTQIDRNATKNNLNNEIKNIQINRNASKNNFNSEMKNCQFDRNNSKNCLNTQMKTTYEPTQVQQSTKIYSTKDSIRTFFSPTKTFVSPAKAFVSPAKTMQSKIKLNFHYSNVQQNEKFFCITKENFYNYPKEIESIQDQQQSQIDEISLLQENCYKLKLPLSIINQKSSRFQTSSLNGSSSMKKQQTDRDEIFKYNKRSLHFK